MSNQFYMGQILRYDNSRVASCQLRVVSCELVFTLGVASCELKVVSCELQVGFTSYQFILYFCSNFRL